MPSILTTSSKLHSPATRAVIYARVSSTKQTKAGDGLNSQVTRCEEFARHKGYSIVRVFQDDISGSLIDRPGMADMLRFLSDHRDDPHVVLIDDLSRLARGLDAHIALRRAISEAGGLLESPSIEFGEDSDSQLVENLLAVVSQHQRQKNGEQTKNRMRARVMNGYWPFRVPMGYRHERVSGQGKMMIRHEPLASIIQTCLEGYAVGRFETQAEVHRYLESLPHFPRDSRGIIRYQRVKEMLTNPLYAGMVEAPNWDVSLREGKHEGLVSFTTFKKIQDRLAAKPVAPVRDTVYKDFALRGFVECGDCGQPLTACWAKGRSKKYPYYHCYNPKCTSYGKSIKRDMLEGEVEEVIQSLQPSPALVKCGFAMFKDLWDQRRSQAKTLIAEGKTEIKRIEKDIDDLVARIVESSSKHVIKAYEKRIAALEAEKLLLQEKAHRAAKPSKPFEECFRTALDFLLNPVKPWDSGDPALRHIVLKLAFARPIIYDRGKGVRTATPSLPFQVIKSLKGDSEGLHDPENNMAHPRGFEPLTSAFGAGLRAYPNCTIGHARAR